MPLCFVDCGRDLEVSHGLTGGRSNPEEAALVARIVSAVLAAGISPSKVAVLAPYSRQVVRELPIQPAPQAIGCSPTRASRPFSDNVPPPLGPWLRRIKSEQSWRACAASALSTPFRARRRT